jgi:hypothetical protein
MTSLTRFESSDSIELVIDIETGEAFATQAGYARMSGLSKQAISKRCLKGVNQNELKTAEILTPGGLQGVRLIPAKQAFQWLIKDNPELAFKMGEVGATVYLHQLAGFKISSSAIEEKPKTPQTYLEALKALVKSEEEKELLRIENEQLAEEVEQLAEAVDELFDYSSIIRIAKFNNVCETNFNWRKLKNVSIAKKLEIKKVPCPRYQTKNLYHHDAWRYAYPEMKLPETSTLTIY